jgi:4-amino-4-deoxy-L-arabinose transferase-like glycosyltransferase
MTAVERVGWRRDAVAVLVVGLVVRLAVVVWASGRIPPTADGEFYHVIATRIARGLGYTWLWPDGAVTYAAHYPVGYPAMVGAMYALVGPYPAVAMVLNAVLGALMALSVHLLALRIVPRRRALAVGLVAALHVAFVAYTPALMTEGATASLWATAVLLAVMHREATGGRGKVLLVGLGLVLGVGVLVRGQTLLLVPFVAWLASPSRAGWQTRVAVAMGVGALCGLVFVPWMVRNQVRMGEAGLSFNGGWNLLIGATPSANGTFAPLEVPEGCREVFDEADKDACFGRAAVGRILAAPAAWLALVPKKLGATLDYCGAGGWYLHAANPGAVSYQAKVALGVAETVFVRGVLVAALVGAALVGGPRRGARVGAVLVGGAFALTVHGWVGYVALLVAYGLLGRAALRLPVPVGLALGATVCVLVSHGVFFGAGRYALFAYPFVTLLAGGVSEAGAAHRTRSQGPNRVPTPTSGREPRVSGPAKP